MANLPLGFAELAAGSILLVAALQNKTPAQVLTGRASTSAPLGASAGAASVPADAPVSPAATQSGIPGTTTVLGAGKGGLAAQNALSFLGDPYLMGGLTRFGIDCSGLVKAAYAKVGIELPHNAAMQWNYVRQHGTVKSLKDVVAGDLIFLEPETSGPGHVAIALGNGQAVEAPHTGDVVKTINLADLVAADHFVGAGSPYRTAG